MKKKFVLFLTAALLAGAAIGCGGAAPDGAANAGAEDSQNAPAENTDGGADSDSADNQDAGNGGIALDGTWPEEPIKIAVEVYDTTDENIIAYMDYYEHLAESFNLEFVFSESIGSPEDELNFAGDCIASGCKAYIGGYNVTMDEITRLLTDAGVYYWNCERGLDEKFAGNEYYLGGTLSIASDGTLSDKSGDYLCGYDLAASLAEAGCRHVVYCNGGASFGIQMFVDRQAGFFDGIADAQANGSDIQFDSSKDVIEGWPGTDTFTAAQTNALTADYDGVACSFSGMEIWIQPIMESGKSDSVKLAGFGTLNDATQMLMENGQLAGIVYEAPETLFGNAIPMILNAMNGHLDLVQGEEGYCAVGVARWIIKDIDSFNKIRSTHEAGDYFVEAQDIAKFLPEYNEGATKKDMIDYYASLTLDHVVR